MKFRIDFVLNGKIVKSFILDDPPITYAPPLDVFMATNVMQSQTDKYQFVLRRIY